MNNKDIDVQKYTKATYEIASECSNFFEKKLHEKFKEIYGKESDIQQVDSDHFVFGVLAWTALAQLNAAKYLLKDFETNQEKVFLGYFISVCDQVNNNEHINKDYQ